MAITIEFDGVAPTGDIKVVEAQAKKLIGHVTGQSCEVKAVPRRTTHGEDSARVGVSIALVLRADLHHDGGIGVCRSLWEICAHEGVVRERVTIRWE